MSTYTPRHAGNQSKHHGSPGYVGCHVCSYRPRHARKAATVRLRLRIFDAEREAS